MWVPSSGQCGLTNFSVDFQLCTKWNYMKQSRKLMRKTRAKPIQFETFSQQLHFSLHNLYLVQLCSQKPLQTQEITVLLSTHTAMPLTWWTHHFLCYPTTKFFPTLKGKAFFFFLRCIKESHLSSTNNFLRDQFKNCFVFAFTFGILFHLLSNLNQQKTLSRTVGNVKTSKISR